ncbi:MAG TPA: hypothetical protein VFW64_13175 [Pseudonocardiaceae bacterium]|nr:hypothetical protein [Pseudonocardiaceae bacterium]
MQFRQQRAQTPASQRKPRRIEMRIDRRRADHKLLERTGRQIRHVIEGAVVDRE